MATDKDAAVWNGQSAKLNGDSLVKMTIDKYTTVWLSAMIISDTND